jgi:hypothetical protein
MITGDNNSQWVFIKTFRETYDHKHFDVEKEYDLATRTPYAKKLYLNAKDGCPSDLLPCTSMDPKVIAANDARHPWYEDIFHPSKWLIFQGRDVVEPRAALVLPGPQPGDATAKKAAALKAGTGTRAVGAPPPTAPSPPPLSPTSDRAGELYVVQEGGVSVAYSSESFNAHPTLDIESAKGTFTRAESPPSEGAYLEIFTGRDGTTPAGVMLNGQPAYLFRRWHHSMDYYLIPKSEFDGHLKPSAQ